MPVRVRLRAPITAESHNMMDIVNSHAFWVVLGVLLMVFEAVIPTVFIFFGLSAWVIAALVAAGLLITLSSQMIAFAAIGLVLMVLLRKTFRRWMIGESTEAKEIEDNTGLVGREAIVVNDFDGFGSVTLNGSHWMAKSTASHKRGERVRVTGNEGNMLFVESI